MADVSEVVNDIEPVEKDQEKKIIDVEDEKGDKKEKETKPKENGKTDSEKTETETNGNTETAEVTATKRKSGAGDAPEGTPAEGATPEKKPKISTDGKDQDATNGEPEVAEAEGANEAKNMSYQKRF